MNAWRVRHKLYVMAISAYHPGDVDIVSTCDNRFVIRNRSHLRVDVVYEATGVDHHMEQELAARPPNRDFSELLLRPPRHGSTMRVFVDDDLVGTASGSNTQCSP